MRFVNVKIGDTVWFHSFLGVDSGEVIDILEVPHRREKIACVKQREAFISIEIDSRRMYLTHQQATLALAEKKQRDAAELLTAAANLFKQEGFDLSVCSSSIGPIYTGPMQGCTYGPNDHGYLNRGIREAARQLVACSLLWSEGHYPHSNARVMPGDHPIRIALKELQKIDEETAAFANVSHNPSLFEPYTPSLENQTRWDKYRGVGGEN